MKKVVPHNRLVKQLESKRRSVQRREQLNWPRSGATKIAWSSSSRDVMVLSSLFIADLLSYSNVGWYNDESVLLAQSVYLFGPEGITSFCLLTCWSRRHGQRRCKVKTTSMHQSSIKYLYYLITRDDDLHRAESLLREQINSWDLLFSKCAGAFGSPSSTKRQRACVEHQKWRTVWP
jgi:hypothetical protein